MKIIININKKVWYLFILIALFILSNVVPAEAAPPNTFWTLVGNSNTDPNLNFLGTTDFNPLIFRTNLIEAMRILPGSGGVPGNVGIGTTTPQTLLDVAGQVRAGSGIKFGDNTIQTTAATPSFWAASGTNIYNTNTGNVGIGTTSPTQPLDILSSVNIDKYIRLINADSGSAAQAGLNLYNGNSDTALVQTGQNFGPLREWNRTNGAYLRSGGPGGLAMVALNPTGVITFHTGGDNEKLRIDSAGRVGIGTTNPQSHFQVVGDYIQFPTIAGGPPPDSDCNSSIHAGRVKVRTDGAINLYICTGATGWVGK